jgi:hypothetical protein
MQVAEATDVVEDALLIIHVRYVLDNYIKEDFCFWKPVDGRATSLEGFSIVKPFLEENKLGELQWTLH